MDRTHQGGLRILFADDEAHLRDLMQMELPRLGHEVTVCADGSAAIRALEKGPYDAALLDMKMPGLTGIEVLAKIKQISPETEVIILTGHATVDTAVQAVAQVAGADAVNADVQPMMISEDFGAFLQAVPGNFVFIGNGETAGPGGVPLHNAGYDFNDEILPVGARYFAEVARRALKAA